MTDKDIIDRLGGSTAVARLCDNKITPQGVQHWKTHGIPDPWRLYLRQVRPDAFTIAAGG